MVERESSKNSQIDKTEINGHAAHRRISEGFIGRALARLHPEGGLVHVFVEKHLGYKDDRDRRHHVRVVEHHPEEGRREHIRPAEEVFHHPHNGSAQSNKTTKI